MAAEKDNAWYIVGGAAILSFLLLLGWFAFRQSSPLEQQPMKAEPAKPQVRREESGFELADDSAKKEIAVQTNISATTNAADLYRQAFALYDAFTNDEKNIIRDWRTNIDAAVEAELCEKLRSICDLMHQAAAVTNCDWGVDRPLRFSTTFPHLLLCRDLARAALWSAAHCQKDDPAGMADNLADTAQLGQNVRPTEVGHRVNLAIEGMVAEFVAAHATMLTDTDDSRLVQLLENPRYVESLSHAFADEAEMYTELANRWAAMPPDEVTQELKSLDETDSFFQSMEPAQAVADMREVAELERDSAKAMGLTETEYGEVLDRVQLAKETNPFVNFFLAGNENVVDKTQLATVGSEMAVAGLAVAQGGVDALQAHPDPSSGLPFVYTETPDGFELQSSYQFNGKPVTMQFK